MEPRSPLHSGIDPKWPCLIRMESLVIHLVYCEFRALMWASEPAFGSPTWLPILAEGEQWPIRNIHYLSDHELMVVHPALGAA